MLRQFVLEYPYGYSSSFRGMPRTRNGRDQFNPRSIFPYEEAQEDAIQDSGGLEIIRSQQHTIKPLIGHT